MAATSESVELGGVDYNKMKVADLKKELKTRGLSVAGNKADLIDRLETALNADEHGLEDGEDETAEDYVLEDDVLADDGKVSDTSYQDEIILNSPTALEGSLIKAVVIPEAKDSDPTPTPETPNNNNSSTEVVPVAKLTDKEKRELRAKKFNLPPPEDEQKKIRAERFGTTNVAKTSTFLSGINSSEALKKRAERFGLATTKIGQQENDSSKLLQRAERFGTNTRSKNTEKDGIQIQKRKERFGTVSQEEELLEKKKKRANRFGLA